MIKIYLAAPIFSESDRMYNEILAKKIEESIPNIQLYVPQRNKSINDKTKCATAEDITKGDFDNNLNHADIVIARVDGDVPPIGTTLEIGYFCRRCQEDIEKNGKTDKRIFSLYTDSREPSHTVNDAKVNMLHEFAESQFSYINLLLVGALKRYGEMFYEMDKLVETVKNYVIKLEKKQGYIPFGFDNLGGSWAIKRTDNSPIFINNTHKTTIGDNDDFKRKINILAKMIKEL